MTGPEQGVAILNSNLPRSPSLSPRTRVDLADNIGNAYISLVMARLLGVAAFTYDVGNIWLSDPVPKHDWSAAAKVIVNLQDHLSLWPDDAHFENGVRHLRAIEAKAGSVLAFSLAANTYEHTAAELAGALSPSCLRFFKTLAHLCSSIGVRGEFTADVLEKLGIRNYTVTGCPSYFEGGPSRRVQAAIDRVDRPLIGVTGRLAVRSHAPVAYYLQGDEEWPVINLIYAPEPWGPAGAAEALGHDWLRRMAQAAADGRTHFFTDTDAWKAHIAQNCIVVGGTRLHGAIVALNAGVPAVVGNGDARAREVCALFGIPWAPTLTEHGGVDPRMLMELADPSQANRLYPQLYETFVGWLRANGFEPADPQASAFGTASIGKVPQDLVNRRLLAAYDEALRVTSHDASARGWTAYTPDLLDADPGVAGAVLEGRYRIEGSTLFINMRIAITREQDIVPPLRARLPLGVRVVAPTAMTGRDVSGGGQLQALADEDYVAIFDSGNRFPVYNGCSLIVSGSCEIAPSPWRSYH